MADWTNISDSSLDPDAPVTSELAYAFRDNPIAIAEGANNAPMIRARAIANPGWVLNSGQSPAVITGLSGERIVPFSMMVAGVSGQTSSLQVSFSSDSGATWTSWFGVGQKPSDVTSSPVTVTWSYDRLSGRMFGLSSFGTLNSVDDTPTANFGGAITSIRVRVATGGSLHGICIPGWAGRL